MVLIIDNYDSFVYNLARYVTLSGLDFEVIRNDKITINEIATRKDDAIILSPGPCTPREAGICIDTIKTFGETTPILGVCLGHQAIGEAYGGKTQQANEHIHGKASLITHNQRGLFNGLPSPMQVGRYHSLITDLSETETELEITARTENDIIMGMQHKTHPVYGVQFHPESILTDHGMAIMNNFASITQAWKTKRSAA